MASGGWRRPVGAAALLALGTSGGAAPAGPAQTDPRLDRGPRVEVSAAPGLLSRPATGRLIVAVAAGGGREPRHRVGDLAPRPTPIFAVDVTDFGAAGGPPAVIDATAAAFPYRSLADLPPGAYRAQAMLDVSRDLRLVDAPGNYYGPSRPFTVGDAGPPAIHLELTERIRDERLPEATDHVRFVRLRSERLSAFHGRPIYLRAGVILPRGYDDTASRRYPLRVRVGGYGTRYTDVLRLMRPGSAFRAAWLADDTPRMLLVHLDGAGPYGDPYQVNSANNGPYGDAVTAELIPHIETRFRGLGLAAARVVDGESTGGWVALALQIFYPHLFNGAWAFCPDAVDFRRFQLIDVYADQNAYVDAAGGERPAARAPDGRARFTMRHEVGMENVLGATGRWTRSGRQWGAWNAVYGPRGADGHPTPLFDPVTGVIDRAVIGHWEAYDLRLQLARRWDVLAPAVAGKLRIWMGTADDYYLDGAVRLLDDDLRARGNPIDARITFGEGAGHCWVGRSPREVMREMGDRTGARP